MSNGSGFLKGLSVFLILVLTISQSGCSLLAGNTTKLSASTQPSDADIFINGQYVGKGVGTMVVPKNQPVDILAKREGYMPANRVINNKISTTGVLDIIGGFIFILPFLGFLSPGSQDLDTHNVNIVLAEK